MLEKGPKYTMALKLEALDKLTLIRQISAEAPQDRGPLIIDERIQVFACLNHQAQAKVSFGPIIQQLRSKQLRLCVSEKQGGFVVVASDTMEKKPSKQ